MEWCLRTGQDVEVVYHKPPPVKALIYGKMLLVIEAENAEIERMREMANRMSQKGAPTRPTVPMRRRVPGRG